MIIRDRLEEVKQTESALQKDFKDKKKIDSVDIQSLFFAFVNRSRFKYTLSDVFRSLMLCLCLKNLGAHRNEKEVKRHFLFEKAQGKFMNELDIVRIVRTMRKFKMLAQAMLTERHRLILRFQRQHLIETTSSSSDSDEEIYEPMRLMQHKDPLVKLVAFGKVKRMMKEFNGHEIDNLERNMMRGMFKRRLKDFSEKLNENTSTL